jgi:molecular chaperone GrpE
MPRPRPEDEVREDEPAHFGQPTASTKLQAERSAFRASMQAELEDWRQKAIHLQALVEQQRRETERLELALEEQASEAAHLQSTLEKQREETLRLHLQLEEQRAQVDQTQGEAMERQEQALRLQAEMDNFRKRQQRLAADQAETERLRLLGDFVRVVDDLERALAAPARESETLRQGVALTLRSARQLLQREGVEPIRAKDQPFDPAWHEAVATVPAADAAGENGRQPDPDTVIQVLEPGYRLGDRLLRPARVVVAVER